MHPLALTSLLLWLMQVQKLKLDTERPCWSWEGPGCANNTATDLFLAASFTFLLPSQVQKLKLDTEAAMLELDQILRANELTVAVVAAIPSLGIAGGTAYLLIRWVTPSPPDRKSEALPARCCKSHLMLLAGPDHEHVLFPGRAPTGPATRLVAPRAFPPTENYPSEPPVCSSVGSPPRPPTASPRPCPPGGSLLLVVSTKELIMWVC